MSFTVQIPVKSYIRAYLVNNCGDPADLTRLPEIHELLTNCLKYPKFHRDNHSKCNYSDTIQVIISQDTFYRHGWALSKTDIVRFNQKCEAMVKFNSRQFIIANSAMGLPVSKCIREFQLLFQFTEDCFSYETIKKDFDRHGKKIPFRFIRDFRGELNNILLDNLSTLGTISKSFKNELNHKTNTSG
jgi:hypothetical protein